MNVTKKQIAAAVGSKVIPNDIDIIASISYNQDYNPYIDSVSVNKIPITTIVARFKYLGYMFLTMDISGKLHIKKSGELIDLLKDFRILLEVLEQHIDKHGAVNHKTIVQGIDLTHACEP